MRKTSRSKHIRTTITSKKGYLVGGGWWIDGWAGRWAGGWVEGELQDATSISRGVLGSPIVAQNHEISTRTYKCLHV